MTMSAATRSYPPTPTSDVCDRWPESAEVVDPRFRDFGGRTAFSGEIATLQVYEDSVLLRTVLAEPGRGRVLVVDGGGSLRCALLGGRMVALAHESGWSGLLLNGCVRDVDELRRVPIGVRALASHPKPPRKTGLGQRGVPVHFASAAFYPGHVLYADGDGMVIVPASAHAKGPEQ